MSTLRPFQVVVKSEPTTYSADKVPRHNNLQAMACNLYVHWTLSIFVALWSKDFRHSPENAQIMQPNTSMDQNARVCDIIVPYTMSITLSFLVCKICI